MTWRSFGARRPSLVFGTDLIHMPFVAASRRALADLIGKGIAELQRPLTYGLVAHGNATLCDHLLDHAKAQGKPEIEPNGVADDLRRKAVAAIEGITSTRHALVLPPPNSKIR